MSVIVLVACAARKVSHPAPAKDLYQSDLFKKSRAWAERHGDAWFILSAKHGLLDPEEVIKPYDVTLNAAGFEERYEWAEMVAHDLAQRAEQGDRVVFLAGADYRSPLAVFCERDYVVEVPMLGLGIGRQLKWLKEAA